MKLKLSVEKCHCSTSEFIINDVVANSDDFGVQRDINSDNAEPYGCGDMNFLKIKPTKEVLEKYHISEVEYNEIASRLEEELSFGVCGWCV